MCRCEYRHLATEQLKAKHLLYCANGSGNHHVMSIPHIVIEIASQSNKPTHTTHLFWLMFSGLFITIYLFTHGESVHLTRTIVI